MEGNFNIEDLKNNINGILAFTEGIIASKKQSLSKDQQEELDKKLEEIDFKAKIKEVRSSTDLLDELKKQM